MQSEMLRLTDELRDSKRDLQAALLTSGESREKVDLDTIVSSGTSLLSILNDILDYSKMEVGFIGLESRSFDPVQTLRDVLKLFEQQASAKGVELKLELPSVGSYVPVRGDGMRLQQMVCNLVSNALKFTEEGSITVTLWQSVQGKELERLTIEVADTGIGIDAPALSHIFERFSQADGSTTRKFGGTGLGLAIPPWFSDPDGRRNQCGECTRSRSHLQHPSDAAQRRSKS